MYCLEAGSDIDLSKALLKEKQEKKNNPKRKTKTLLILKPH